MKILEGIQAIKSQTLTTSIDNGESVTLTITFNPAIKMWFLSVEYKDFIVNNLRLCNIPNVVQQFWKTIPFGLTVIIEDGTEPYIINDFYTGRCKIGILTKDEVLQINSSYEEGKE